MGFRSFHLGSAVAAATLAVAATLVSLAAVPAAAAEGASNWSRGERSAVRLLAAGARSTDAGAVLRAGVEIKLDAGWKTYWRYPGDSGVPPMFDFSKSDNVKSVQVLFPAPKRFSDGGGGSSIGYKGGVVLPLHVVAQDARRPVTLRLKLDYAVCDNLCLPAEAVLELALAGTAPQAATQAETAVAAAEALVPKAAALGQGEPAIRAVRRDTADADKPRVVVDVAVADGRDVALFAEGPTPQWALPLPEPVAGAPAGLRRFAFALDGVPPGASLKGAVLRLTAVSAGNAVEVAFRLD